jgi:hypothetical protein
MNNVIQLNNRADIIPDDVSFCDQVRAFETNYGFNFLTCIQDYSLGIGYYSMKKLNLGQDVSSRDVLDIMQCNFNMSLRAMSQKYTEYFGGSIQYDHDFKIDNNIKLSKTIKKEKIK